MLFGDGGDCLAALRQGLTLLQSREQILLNWQPSALIGVEDDALQVDHVAAARVGELAIELADVGQRLVRPIARSDVLREPHSVRQQHRVLRDVFARVEILRQQRRRHNQRVASVREPFARRAIDRELFGRIERRHAGQIADGVGVFGIAQPPEHDWPRIARARQRLGVEIPLDPASQLLALLDGRLLRVLRRHLAVIEHLDDLEPSARPASDVIELREAFEIEFTLLLRRRVTVQTKLLHQRSSRRDVFARKCGEGVRLRLSSETDRRRTEQRQTRGESQD